MLFGVYINDYKNKKTILLKNYRTRENALEFLQDFIYTYILTREGDMNKERLITRKEPSTLTSSSWKSFPEGYSICNSKEGFYRQTIYRKELIFGYLSTSYIIHKILSIDIIEISDIKSKIDEDYYNTVDSEIAIHFFDKVIPELMEKFKCNLNNIEI